MATFIGYHTIISRYHTWTRWLSKSIKLVKLTLTSLNFPKSIELTLQFPNLLHLSHSKMLKFFWICISVFNTRLTWENYGRIIAYSAITIMDIFFLYIHIYISITLNASGGWNCLRFISFHFMDDEKPPNPQGFNMFQASFSKKTPYPLVNVDITMENHRI